SRCGKMFPLAHTARHGEDRLCLDCKAIVSKKNRPAGPLSAENLDYAPILLRFAAAFLDGLVMGAFNIALLYLSGTMIRARNNASTLPTIEIVLCGVAMLIAASYEGIMVGTYGATFGKMACRIKVVTSNGGHVSHARAFGRFFAKQLSVLPCLLGFIIAIFDNPRNRTLHDRLCNTRVVRR
ncbi:MAG TPA: RDD family protein, partial [Desulfuromonadaceae bacterium]|nr:RDD family protein [Desulfuromonadaceae bacterium]